MDWERSLYGLSIILVNWGLLFLMFRYYHWERFFNGNTEDNKDHEIKNVMPTRNRNMNKSEGGYQRRKKKKREVEATFPRTDN